MTIGFSPAGLLQPMRQVARQLRRSLRDRLRGETRETLFDFHDRERVNEILDCGPSFRLPCDAAEAEIDRAGAMRYVLSRLLTDLAVRRRYPKALRDGTDGAFAQSFAADKQLSQAARANIREAFESKPGWRLLWIYESRSDLREVFPLAFTPRQRGDYLHWLVTHGARDLNVVPEEALWFLVEQDETPDRGLVATYRLQAEWQAAVPHGLTRFGWDQLKQWVQGRYDFSCRWLTTARLEKQYCPWDELKLLARAEPGLAANLPNESSRILDWVRSTPRVAKYIDRDWRTELNNDIAANTAGRLAVNVVGLFRYTSGLQNAVNSCVESLTSVGVRTALRDVPVASRREGRSPRRFDDIEVADVTVINTGLDMSIGEAYVKSGLHKQPGVHRVGIWWWELESLPTEWHNRDTEVDEIWSPTRFIADAMRRVYRKPIYPMLPGLELPAFAPMSKADFGLDPARFTFCFVFDINSVMQRKNPMGLIEVFRRAFHPSDAVNLVIKVSAQDQAFPELWKELRAGVAATPNVTLLDRVMTRSQVLGLMDAADAYVSLHRSEGFSLTCAEAMLMGKPVIATNYSGNLDYMTNENSYLVDYRLVEITKPIFPYPAGAHWAEPDVNHAAAVMREVFANRADANARGQRAKQELTPLLSVVAAGERMRQRLEEIRQSRGR